MAADTDGIPPGAVVRLLPGRFFQHGLVRYGPGDTPLLPGLLARQLVWTGFAEMVDLSTEN